MSDKAAKKKQYILDTAKNVFSKQGFKNVTMKDIVEACEISRGGLYIYFDSTEAIFEEILKQDCHDCSMPNVGDESKGQELAVFLQEEKKAILLNQDDLTVAVYEYLFKKHAEGTAENVLKPVFDSKVELVSKILEEGVEAGDFYCDDTLAAARNIMYVIEGLKIAAKTYGVTESDIDTEFVYILSGLIAEE